MKQPIIIFASVCIASAGFVAWRVNAMRHHTVNRYAVLYDESRSFTGGCSSLAGAAGKVLSDRGVSEGSTLTVLALGDGSTADEPRRLAEYAIPSAQKVIEGRRANVERRVRLLQDLVARCRSVRPTLVTPIYLGFEQALADLHGQGCTGGSHCGLWVTTDLEENGDRAIEARIRGVVSSRDPLPARLNNTGINVTFCGYAQTAGRIVGRTGQEIAKVVTHDPRRDRRLLAVWSSLFSDPQLVRFEPYCPEPDILPAHVAVGEQRGH